MKKKISLFMLLACFMPFVNAQWVRGTGTEGKSFVCFAVSGTTLFAGTNGYGIYKSSDNGTTWSKTAYPETYAKAMMANGTTIYAVSWGSGLFKSIDLGTTWTKVVTSWTTKDILSMVSKGGNIYIVNGDGLYMSANNGSTFTKLSGIVSADILAIGGSNFYASNYGQGVFLSTDNGSTWNPVNTGIVNKRIKLLKVDGSNLMETAGDSVFLSTNNGGSWTMVYKPATGFSSPLSLGISGNKLFIGTNYDGLYLSINNGVTWTNMTGNLSKEKISALLINSNIVFAAEDGSGVYKRPLSDFTGLDALKEAHSINVYPNPGTGEFKFKSDILAKEIKVKVVNLLGQLIYSTNIADPNNESYVKIDIGSSPNGIYILEIESGNKIYSSKLIVIH